MASTGGRSVVVRTGDQSVRLELGGRCRIGRSSRADLRIPDATVSRMHAEVAVGDSGVCVTDLGSKRGTFLGGGQITAPTLLTHGTTINLAGLDGPEVVVEEAENPSGVATAGGHAAPDAALLSRLRRKPAVVAAALLAALAGIVALRALWPGGGASAEDQLVMTTIQPATAAPWVGTAVVVDGDRRLVALPHAGASDDSAAYTVHVRLEDGRVYDVAGISVATADGIDIVQLVGADAVPEVAAQLEDFGSITLGDLSTTPDRLWTLGLREEGLPGPASTPIVADGGDRVTAEPDQPVAFAPMLDGGRLVGFASAGCVTRDGTTRFALVDAGSARDPLDAVELNPQTVAPAPVPSAGGAAPTPAECT